MAKPIIKLKPEKATHIQFSVRPGTKVRHQQFMDFCHKRGVDVVAVVSDNLGDFFSELEVRIDEHINKTQNSAIANGAAPFDGSR